MADVVVGELDEEVVRAHEDLPPHRAEPRARRVRDDPFARHRRSGRRLVRGGGGLRRGSAGRRGARVHHDQPPHAPR
jgi:hypothetical protein